MKLQTEIQLNPEGPQIDYSSKTLLLGSCFSENIGAKFDFLKFQNLQNPFGVIFNPVSIEKLVVRSLENDFFSEEDIFRHNGIWKCFEAHSQLSALDKEEFLANLNSTLKRLREALFSSTHIIFTFGTSWVFRHVESDQIVANCHKLPQQHFKKELLSIDTVSESLQNTMEKIAAVKPEVSIITTVSPVRHLKDGFVENTLSKAHLISAIHNFKNRQSEISNLQPYYFPSYEIVMDELRDYRFYAEDMLHPNQTAVDIIWEKFSKVWISPQTVPLQKKIAAIQRDLQHRPFYAESEDHRHFKEKLRRQISQLQHEYPHIRF